MSRPINLKSILRWLCLSVLLLPLGSYAQTLTKELIFSSGTDSLPFPAPVIQFDREGNYCYELEQDELYYLVTNRGSYGPFPFIGYTVGPNGGIRYTRGYSDPEDKLWYYKNADGAAVYGPVRGEMEGYFTGTADQSVGLTVRFRDSLYYFVDDRLTAVVSDSLSSEIGHDDWGWLAADGNFLNQEKQGDQYLLLGNDSLVIDRSEDDFYQLRINNKGNYCYAKGRAPTADEPYDRYLFFLHTQDTVFGPVRTAWETHLKENGGYYFSGFDVRSDYLLINDTLFRDVDDVADLTLLDPSNFLFTYSRDDRRYVNVNGNSYALNYEEVFYPTLDTAGNFALYGLRDYYLYRFVNGEEIPAPITNYGVRPTPWYISPTGASLHVFKTDDSTYVSQDDHLLFPPFSNREPFSIQPFEDILYSSFTSGGAANRHSLLYLEIDSTGYVVFDGQLSRPMLPRVEGSWSAVAIGQIVSGALNDTGFFIIQKTGAHQWLININNRYYQEIENVDQVFRESCYFDDRGLVFYGSEGGEVYRYNISL